MSSKPDNQPSVRVEINHGVVANRIEALHVHTAPAQPYEHQVADYYRKVAKACRIATMDDHHPVGRQNLPYESAVAQVYVEPDVWKVTMPPTADEKSERPTVQQEQPEHRERLKWQSCFDSPEEGLRQLLLVADGGMGKTTAVDVQIQRLVDKGDMPWMALRLPRVKVTGSKVGDGDVVEGALIDDIAAKLNLADSQADLVTNEVLNRLDKQAGVILLDALDEVPQSERQRVVAGVLRFLNRLWARQPNHKVVITSRAYAVEGGAVGSDLATAGFVRLELAWLSKEQRTELVQKYFAVRGRDAQVGAALLRQLTASDSGGNEAMGELMREPMLATYVCMLAEARTRAPNDIAFDWPLPATRHELLDSVVELLLEKWDLNRRDSEQTALFSCMFVPDTAVDPHRSRLRRVVEEAASREHLHKAEEKAAKSSKGQLVPDLPSDWQLQRLYEAFYQGEAQGALTADWLIACIDRAMLPELPVRAHRVAQWLTQRSGLMRSELRHRADEPRMQHRQLADFLAAGALGHDRSPADHAKALVEQAWFSPDWSRQMITLGFERLVVAARRPNQAANSQAFCEGLEHWRAWCEGMNPEDTELFTAVLAQALAQTVPADWVTSDKALNTALDPLRQRLVTMMAEQRLSAPERAAAADALGKLGDPRFVPGMWLPRKRFSNNSESEEPLPGFICIKASDFTMKYLGKRILLRQHHIKQDFLISRFQVTVAQYSRFLKSGGYEAGPAIWGRSGWEWKVSKSRVKPINWEDQCDKLHRPVVGVTWWEVKAFVRWLQEDMTFQSWVKDTGKTEMVHVSLPTEAHWERVARMTQSGTSSVADWPWGNDLNLISERANLLGVGRPAVVGCFTPNPFGIYDLIGNVWEWMDNHKYRLPSRYFMPISEGLNELLEGRIMPALRGGSFNCTPEFAKICSPNAQAPEFCANDVGFRIILAAC
jgi:formylglycine-generating enzyme required for sulfatase activity